MTLRRGGRPDGLTPEIIARIHTLRQPNKRRAEIAAALGVPLRTYAGWLARLHLSDDATPPDWFTPARVALIERDYPAGVERQEIVYQCNLLPGRMITASGLTRYANKQGLRRPNSRPAVYQTLVAPLPINTSSLLPVEADAHTVALWAKRNKVPLPATLGAINAQRMALGVSPFALMGRRA